MPHQGKYYHLYNRGNDKMPIFFEEDNYLFFLKQFANYLIPHIDVFAYCLMSNHFHFFIRVNDQNAFQKGIKNLFISYSKSINKRYGKVGHLFQGSYKLSEITTESYFTHIIKYIHQNPVLAGLVKKPDLYKYSSYKAYLAMKPTLLCKNEILELFGGINGFVKDHEIPTPMESREWQDDSLVFSKIPD